MLENYFKSKDTITKILKIEERLNYLFRINEEKIDLVNKVILIMKTQPMYLSDRLYEEIAEVIQNYFKIVFGSSLDLSSSYSWSKIVYNHYLFKDGDFVLKNEIKDDQKNIIPKDLILFYGIIYFPEKIKTNLEKMRGNKNERN